MKLIRYGQPGQEKPGILAGNQYYDAANITNDYDKAFFASDGIARLKIALEANKLPILPTPERLGAPIADPSKIICVGLNYKDHARETNAAIPAEPILFFKATTAICGPNDPLVIPRNSTKTDWEVELAVVIGKKASYVTLEEAKDHIAGYCLHNDYSERAFQLERGGQWVKGKSCDTFAPLGPWLVTSDEIPNEGDLRLWLTVNGQKVQDGTTRDLIFDVPYLVHYISQFMTLLPGDIISTGTPAGVGLGQKPEPWYIKPGDIIELGIDGLGSSRQLAEEWREG